MTELDQEERQRLETGERDLRTRILSLQERFGYVFLALSGSAIAYAITHTADQPRACWMIAALLAVLSWGASFVLSANHLLLKKKALLEDWRIVCIRLGREGDLSPQQAEQAIATLHRQKFETDRISGTFGRWAFYLFLFGGLIYLLAHIQRICCPLRLRRASTQGRVRAPTT